jgi:tetratricopeptide (TPR) repeat protein
MARGAMPELKRLVSEGAGGTLVSFHPMLSPLVWTTMVTGRDPTEHGILDFTRLHPASGREEPITSDERRVPALWNMATDAGRRVVVVGLWATYPAEAVAGAIVSDRVFPLLQKADGPAAGLVFPRRLLSEVREARARTEQEISFETLRDFLPDLGEPDYRRAADAADPYAHPVSALRRILVETALTHRLAATLFRREHPTLTIAYFEGTDTIGHVFAPYAEPRRPGVAEPDFERYRGVGEAYFRYVDRLLGEYREMAERVGGVLLLASDHGFRWGEDRPPGLSGADHTTASAWHRRGGIYLLWGRGVAAMPGHPHRGSVYQVASTVLALLDLPPLPRETPLPAVTPSPLRPVDYADGYRRPTPAPPEEAVGTEALKKLRALGYLGGAAGRDAPPGGSTRTAASYANECLILRLRGRHERALAAAEAALARDSRQATALWCLSDLLFPDPGQAARSDEALVRAFAEGLPDGVPRLAARAAACLRAGDAARGRRLLDDAARRRPPDPAIRRAQSRYAVDRGDCAAARVHAEAAVATSPTDTSAHAVLGLARICLGDEAGARASLLRAGVSEAEARRELAGSALARGDLVRAEREAARVSGEPTAEIGAALVRAQVDLRRSRPASALRRLEAAERRRVAAGLGPVATLEFLRGDALARLGRATEAEAAFRTEIHRFPSTSAAYARLAAVLALGHRPETEVRQVLQAMYDTDPRRETALLAARTAASLGDEPEARRWRERSLFPVDETVLP